MKDKSYILKSISELGKRIMPVGGHVWLYGSQARGDARKNSDWDLLLLLDKPKQEWEVYLPNAGDKYSFIKFPLCFSCRSFNISEIDSSPSIIRRRRLTLSGTISTLCSAIVFSITEVGRQNITLKSLSWKNSGLFNP